MTPRTIRSVFLYTLCAALVISCSPRRGGGGGGGGDDDDNGPSEARTGAGRSTGDATPGADFSAGDGPGTLYVVNFSGGTVDYVTGWECSEEQWFSSPEVYSLEDGTYAEIDGLMPGCWYFEAFANGQSFDHSAEEFGGQYTWVLGERAGGDDDDDDDTPIDGDDDDDGPRVSIYNKSGVDFFELVAFDLSDFEQTTLCSPFDSGDLCERPIGEATWAFIAFTDSGRMDNADNCWLGTDETYPMSGDDWIEIALFGEVQCGF